MSSGCERKTALQCSNNSDVQKDGFFRMSKVDWLDNNTLRSKISSDKECQSSCLNSYSCIVYAFEQKLDRMSKLFFFLVIHLTILQSYLSLFSHITCIHFAKLGTQLDLKIN